MLRVARRYTLNLLDYVYILVGSFIVALAFQVFLLPNNIVSGGVTGISIIANDVFGWDPALTQYGLNIPLLIVCYVFIGKAAGNKTVLGSLATPFYLQFIGDLDAWTTDPFLATVIGGAVTGIGLGIVFRARASSGGTSVIAQLINTYGGFPFGTSTLIADGIVIILGLLTFDFEAVLYSIISLFIIAKAIDFVQVGLSTQKNVFIISDSPAEIRHEIMNTLKRGVTNLGIRGGYGNTDKDMLMVVIQEREFTFLKDAILDVDEDAFVVVMSASEVLGRGFSLTKDFESIGRTSYYDEIDEETNGEILDETSEN